MSDDSTMVLRKKVVSKVNVQNKQASGSVGTKVVDELTGEVFKKTTKQLDKTKIDSLIKQRGGENLDQKALATKLNLPHSEIKNAELGKEIRLKTYNAICKYVNV
jgi:hypothetical protein